jgi:phosphatidylglycerophosphatase A
MPRIRKLIVTGLGTGYLPVAPGTWGSAAVAGVFVLLARIGAGEGGVWAAMAVIAALASVGCIALGRFAEQAFGRKDPSQCSLDEWAGQALTYLLLPAPADWKGLALTAGAGFLAFRLFDIVKPPPAGGIQKLPAGWGILLDDLVAAVYANVACQLLLRLWLLR